MKTMGLIDLMLILILVSNGQSWNVSVPRSITATPGSNVIIRCAFTVPPEHKDKRFQVYWKKRERSNFNTFDKDRNAFVFHPNATYVLEKYRGKTKLIGDKSQGNCSLKISNIRDNVANIYVRLGAKEQNFSFVRNPVSVFVSDLVPNKKTNVNQTTPTLQSTTIFYTLYTTQETAPQWHVAIYAPVVAIVIVIFVVGIVFAIRHKRSKSSTRKDSGYYANFSRANNLKSEVSCKKPESIKLSKEKDTEDPVYVNFEAPPDQMHQHMDHTDNIYGNVDY